MGELMNAALAKMAEAEAIRQRWLLETEPEKNAALEEEWEAAMAAGKAAVLEAAEEEG